MAWKPPGAWPLGTLFKITSISTVPTKNAMLLSACLWETLGRMVDNTTSGLTHLISEPHVTLKVLKPWPGHLANFSLSRSCHNCKGKNGKKSKDFHPLKVSKLVPLQRFHCSFYMFLQNSKRLQGTALPYFAKLFWVSLCFPSYRLLSYHLAATGSLAASSADSCARCGKSDKSWPTPTKARTWSKSLPGFN